MTRQNKRGSLDLHPTNDNLSDANAAKKIKIGNFLSFASQEIDGNKENLVLENKKKSYEECLKSYSTLNWFAKPSCLSPITCAQHGWMNIDKDVLRCNNCRALISGRLPSAHSPKVYRQCRDRILKLLTEGHHISCHWRSSSYQESHFIDKCDRTQKFLTRVKSLISLEYNLPVVQSFSDRLCLNNEITQEQMNLLTEFCHQSLQVNKSSLDMQTLQTAIKLAIFGWEFNSSSQIKCTCCLRVLGLWNYYSLQDQESGKTEPSNSLDLFTEEETSYVELSSDDCVDEISLESANSSDVSNIKVQPLHCALNEIKEFIAELIEKIPSCEVLNSQSVNQMNVKDTENNYKPINDQTMIDLSTCPESVCTNNLSRDDSSILSSQNQIKPVLTLFNLAKNAVESFTPNLGCEVLSNSYSSQKISTLKYMCSEFVSNNVFDDSTSSTSLAPGQLTGQTTCQSISQQLSDEFLINKSPDDCINNDKGILDCEQVGFTVDGASNQHQDQTINLSNQESENSLQSLLNNVVEESLDDDILVKTNSNIVKNNDAVCLSSDASRSSIDLTELTGQHSSSDHSKSTFDQDDVISNHSFNNELTGLDTNKSSKLVNTCGENNSSESSANDLLSDDSDLSYHAEENDCYKHSPSSKLIHESHSEQNTGSEQNQIFKNIDIKNSPVQSSCSGHHLQMTSLSPCDNSVSLLNHSRENSNDFNDSNSVNLIDTTSDINNSRATLSDKNNCRKVTTDDNELGFLETDSNDLIHTVNDSEDFKETTTDNLHIRDVTGKSTDVDNTVNTLNERKARESETDQYSKTTTGDNKFRAIACDSNKPDEDNDSNEFEHTPDDIVDDNIQPMDSVENIVELGATVYHSNKHTDSSDVNKGNLTNSGEYKSQNYEEPFDENIVSPSSVSSVDGKSSGGSDSIILLSSEDDSNSDRYESAMEGSSSSTSPQSDSDSEALDFSRESHYRSITDRLMCEQDNSDIEMTNVDEAQEEEILDVAESQNANDILELHQSDSVSSSDNRSLCSPNSKSQNENSIQSQTIVNEQHSNIQTENISDFPISTTSHIAINEELKCSFFLVDEHADRQTKNATSFENVWQCAAEPEKLDSNSEVEHRIVSPFLEVVENYKSGLSENKNKTLNKLDSSQIDNHFIRPTEVFDSAAKTTTLSTPDDNLVEAEKVVQDLLSDIISQIGSSQNMASSDKELSTQVFKEIADSETDTATATHENSHKVLSSKITKKQCVTKTTRKIVPLHLTFDPISQHHTWCPFISSQSENTPMRWKQEYEMLVQAAATTDRDHKSSKSDLPVDAKRVFNVCKIISGWTSKKFIGLK